MPLSPAMQKLIDEAMAKANAPVPLQTLDEIEGNCREINDRLVEIAFALKAMAANYPGDYSDHASEALFAVDRAVGMISNMIDEAMCEREHAPA